MPGNPYICKGLLAIKNGISQHMEVIGVMPIAGQISRNTSRDIWNFSRYLKFFMYLFYHFSRDPIDIPQNHRVSRNPAWETLLQAKDGRVPPLNQDDFLQIISNYSLINDITFRYYDSVMKKSQTIATSVYFA
jgi:hypothetical protein